MLLEAFHFDLCSKEMSFGRVKPYTLMGRPDWEEAAQTLAPEKLRRVKGQWTLRMAKHRGKNCTTTQTACEECFQTHHIMQEGSLPIFQMR